MAAGLRVLLLAALCVFALPAQTLDRDFILGKIRDALRAEGIQFEARRFDYNIFLFSATLTDVRLRAAAAPKLDPFLTAAKIELNIDLTQLVRGAFRIQDGLIEKPRLHVVVTESGATNLPRTPGGGGSSSTPLLIERLRVNAAELLLEDRRRKLGLHLPVWHGAVEGDPRTGVHRISLDSGGGRALYEGRALAVLSAAGRFEFTQAPSLIRIHRFALRTSHGAVSLAGSVNNLADPVLDLRLECDAAIDGLAAFAGVRQDLAGSLKLQATAAGPLSRARIAAAVEGRDLRAAGMDPIALQAAIRYQADQPWLHVSSFTASAPGAGVSGHAALALDAAGTSTASVSLRGVDLARLARTFDLPVRVASRASGTVEAHWPGLLFRQAEGRADLRLDASAARPSRNLLPVAGSLAARYEGGRLAVSIRGLRALAAQVSGSLTLTAGERLSGEVRAGIDDAAQVMAQLDRFLGRPAGAAAGFELAGPVTIVANLGGTLRKPRADLDLSTAGVQVAGTHKLAVRAKASYDPGRLEIREAVVQWGGQSLSAQGSIGLEGRRPLDLALHVRDARIEAVLSALRYQGVPAGGVVSAEVRVRGTVDEPRAAVEVSARDLAAYGESLGTLSATASFEAGTLRVTALRLEQAPGGWLDAAGSYTPGSRQFQVQVTGEDLRIRRLAIPGVPALQATLKLRGEGGGSIGDPRGTFAIGAEDLTVGGEPAGSVSLNAAVSGGKAEVELTAPRYALAGRATLGVRPPYPASFEVTAENLDLALVPLNLQPALTGAVTAALRGSGELENWRQGQATVSISRLETSFNGQPVRTEGPLEAAWRGETLTIAPATVTIGDSRLEIAGTLPLERAAQDAGLRLRGDFDVAGLAALLPAGAQQVRAGGRATLDAVLRGSLRALEPSGTLTVADLSVEAPGAPPLTGGAATVRIGNGAVFLEQASAEWAGATLRATAEVPLGVLPPGLPLAAPAGGPARATLTLDKLNLGALPGVPEEVGGTVTLHLEAQAPRLALDALTARAEFREFALHAGAFELRQDAPSVIVIKDAAARVERFVLSGPESRIEITGGADLGESPRLGLRAAGKLDAAILTALAPIVRAQGPVRFDVAVAGTPAAPLLTGFIETDNLQAGIESPQIALERLDMRLNLNGARVEIARFEGVLNGGKLTAAGGFSIAGESAGAAVKIAAADVYLNAPSGLKTLSNAELTLQSRGRNLVLAGDVTVLEGSYTEPLTLEGGLMEYLRSGQQVEFTGERSPLLSRVRFQVGLRTESPLVVDNNLARIGVDADLRLLGNWYQPGLTGRVRLEDGGEIRLNERTYLVDRGVITFTNQQRIEPAFDILAKTQVSGYDISLQVTGPFSDTRTTLTSDPPLGETDIIAVLVTGRTLKDVRGSEVNIAKEQAMSYVAGRLGQTLSTQAQRTLGVSTFRIEPGLIAAEANPTARLTVGQNITRRLNLIYSMDLVNSGDQIWITEYNLARRFVARGIKQQDNSYRLEFRHDFQFGGAPGARTLTVRPARRRVGTVGFTGDTRFTEEQLRGKFGLKTGKTYDFFRTRKGLDRLQEMYADAGLLEARIRMRRDTQPTVVNLGVEIAPGPEVQFAFEGWSVPARVKREVRRIWLNGVFDRERAGEAVNAIRAGLVRDGHYEATVEYAIREPAQDRKLVVFEIHPNARYSRLELVFQGAQGIQPAALRDALEEQEGMLTRVHTDPRAVRDFLTAFYREAGYLDVEVEERRYEFDRAARAARAVIPIREGPAGRVGGLRFEGNRAYTEAELRDGLALAPGGPYTPKLRAKAHAQLQELYWNKGYNSVEIAYGLNRRAGVVDVAFHIVEGRQRVVAEVRVEGADQTSEAFVRGQIPIGPRDVLTNDAMNKARGNLYATGAYSLVELDAQPVRAESAATPGAKPGAESGVRPVNVIARLQEIKPFALLYGGFYDTDRGPGGIVDFSNRNTLGAARVLGLRARYDAQFREGRLYFSQPLLRTFPLRTTAATFVQREIQDAFITDRVGVLTEQETRFGDRYVATFGYRLERTHTYDKVPDPDFPFDVLRRLAPLTASITRETRDAMLDATRGSFTSHSFQWAPAFLGSELRFVKYFGQYFRYFPLSAPVEIPWTGERRPRLVFATGARLGLAAGLGGQQVVPSERFFAGGGTTIRGFRQDGVGPQVDGSATGGNGLLILNNELRFPLFSIFDGVSFLDLGNVYRTVSDFSLTGIRKSAGLGLRVRTPYFLLRLDYGMKLDRRPGEGSGRIFFSIGQAF